MGFSPRAIVFWRRYRCRSRVGCSPRDACSRFQCRIPSSPDNRSDLGHRTRFRVLLAQFFSFWSACARYFMRLIAQLFSGGDHCRLSLRERTGALSRSERRQWALRCGEPLAALVVLLLGAVSAAAAEPPPAEPPPDTAVVCPAEFRAAPRPGSISARARDTRFKSCRTRGLPS